MHESHVNVTSAHGIIPSFYVVPDLDTQWPAIILYMDAPGIREELYNIARRIAGQGYACIVPDLYHRYGTLRFDLSRRNEGMTSVLLAAYHGLTDADINQDTAGLIGYLDGRSEVRSDQIGSIGFCMSGRFITTVATQFSERFACAASLYGTRLVTEDDDSPHLHLEGERFYFHSRSTRDLSHSGHENQRQRPRLRRDHYTDAQRQTPAEFCTGSMSALMC